MIVTQGYYAAGDGGAATFEVQENISPDDIFVHSIYGNVGKFAVLVMENGVVSADAIGCQSAESDPRFDVADVRDDYGDWYTNYLATGDFYDDENADRIQAAMDHANVRELQFSSGKWYPLLYGIQISQPNKTINGNGSLLFIDQEHAMEPVFTIEPSGLNEPQKISLRNIRLATVFVPPLTPCILAQDAQAIHLENVDFLMSYCGLIAQSCENVTLRNIRSINCIKVIRVSGVVNLAAQHIRISKPCQYAFSGTDLTQDNSLFYFGANAGVSSARCFLSDIGVEDTTCLKFVHVEGASRSKAAQFAFDRISADLPYDSVRANFTAFRLNLAEFVSIANAHVSQTGAALDLTDTESVEVTACMFERASYATDPSVKLSGTACAGARIDNCTFESDLWFKLATRTAPITGDNLVFRACTFRAGDCSAASDPPALFQSSVTNIAFNDCTFVAQEISDGGMFKLYSDASTDSKFGFFGCRFIMTSAVDNAPIRVSLNGGQNVKTLLLGNALHDFRWTTRVCKDTSADTGTPIDPAANGVYPDNTAAASAASALTAMGRFAAKDNLFVYSSNSTGYQTYYKNAAEYGVAQ